MFGSHSIDLDSVVGVIHGNLGTGAAYQAGLILDRPFLKRLGISGESTTGVFALLTAHLSVRYNCLVRTTFFFLDISERDLVG